ncbi:MULTISPECIES: hypothetical protein [unclassified Streptomyces]
MEPLARHLGPEVPGEQLIWQDPLPQPVPTPLDRDAVTELKPPVLDAGHRTEVALTPGRVDAPQEHTDVNGFAPPWSPWPTGSATAPARTAPLLPSTASSTSPISWT